MPHARRAISRRAEPLPFNCGSQRYLETVAARGARYALDGTVCGEVTKLQREAAKARLEAVAKARLRKAGEVGGSLGSPGGGWYCRRPS